MRLDGRTETTQLIVAFRNFANWPKNGMPQTKNARQNDRVVNNHLPTEVLLSLSRVVADTVWLLKALW
jgi:hypothetical protein